MKSFGSKPWFSRRTGNVLGSVLLALVIIVAGLVIWQSSRPSSVEKAAQEVAVAFASLDYRDRNGWIARVKELSTEEGWAFWNGSLQQGMWEQVESKELVTTRVKPQEARVLKVWDDSSAYVHVKIHAKGHTRDGTFNRDYDYKFLMVPAGEGKWLFGGLMPAKAVK